MDRGWVGVELESSLVVGIGSDSSRAVGKLIRAGIKEGTRRSSSLRAEGSSLTTDQFLLIEKTCTRVEMRSLTLYGPQDRD